MSSLSTSPGESPAFVKKRKTVKLFWKELKQSESPRKCKFGRGTVWASLDKVMVDTNKLEHLFESKAKDLPVAKVTAFSEIPFGQILMELVKTDFLSINPQMGEVVDLGGVVFLGEGNWVLGN